MPPPDLGSSYAAAHETEELTYDQYCGLACRTVSVDLAHLADRLTELVQSADLRRTLGASGRARAEAELDWRIIYRKYQELWAELARVRAAALRDPAFAKIIASAPGTAASRLDPMRAFAHYPTRLIGPDSKLAGLPGASIAQYRNLARDPLFSYVPEALPAEELVGVILEVIAGGTATPSGVAERSKTDIGKVILSLAVLAKMGLVRVEG